jgi:hypothetical protein
MQMPQHGRGQKETTMEAQNVDNHKEKYLVDLPKLFNLVIISESLKLFSMITKYVTLYIFCCVL